MPTSLPPSDLRVDLAVVTSTNQHIPELKELLNFLCRPYRVRARFEYRGFNGEQIYCGGQKLVWRPGKFKTLQLGENVRLLAGNLSLGAGGSHHYPSVAHKEAWCELEFLCYGPPAISSINGWAIHILSFDPLI